MTAVVHPSVAPDANSDVAKQVQRFLDLLWKPGDVREVRVPKHNKYRHTASGYFATPADAVAALAPWDRHANVYITLNPVNPALLARANCRIVENADHATSDIDIVRRDWLFIDIDSIRPSGISATPEEVGHARAAAIALEDYLSGRGWPEPVRCCSGNGYYLLYRLDLPNDAAATQLCANALGVLARQFDDEHVHIDTTVSNAARIIGVVGTVKMKGDEVGDRRHRRSLIEALPTDVRVVGVDRLQSLAPASDGRANQVGPAREAGANGKTLAAMLQAGGIDYKEQPPDANGVTWYHVKRCPWHEDGRDYECGVGQKLPDGPYAAHCFHPEGDGQGWREWRPRLGLGVVSSIDVVQAADAPKARKTDLFSPFSLLSQRTEQPEWPEQPGSAAFHGLAGEIVGSIEAHSEADPVALLVNTLLGFGSLVGTDAYFMVGATRHYPREFAALVGRTSKARKGDSWPPVAAVLATGDDGWVGRVAGGLSTGEGLIHAVRDQVEKQEPIRDKRRIVGYQPVIVDEGVADKRLLVIEPELAKVLKVMERQGNSLSPVLRQAWDSGTLRVMTRSNPLTATGAHISLIGHITMEEFTKLLPDVEAANGFMNRFVIVCVRRSQLLADPTPFQGAVLHQLGGDIEKMLISARSAGQMTRDAEAGELWEQMYADLAKETEGMAGAVLARAEAHVLRLSMLYALLDGSNVIRVAHLGAAAELWAYSERSVQYIFGDATGDPVADTIVRALEMSGEMTRTDISALFGRHESGARIAQALRLLAERGRARVTHVETGGRPSEVWRPVG